MGAMRGKLNDAAKALFAAALERPEGEREAFLAQTCAGDPALRAQVETLLRNHGDAEQHFEEAPPPLGEQPGEHIAHFKLRQKIGEGGFGVVWMAEQEEPVRRLVALKVLKPGMDSAQVIARFEAERQALALMDHPNIAKVFDGGATPSGRPYFVMELVKGMPITNYCDGAGLGVAERLELFVQVCHAVQHAHQKGVIHRDLKPSNVLVTLHDGEAVPKVIDFGIAKAARGTLTQRTVFTQFRQMLGTPEYMAPEQADISALDVDTRADVYSLGVLLYELLTGTRPFEMTGLLDGGYDELVRTIREVDPPKPSTRVSTLGDKIAEIARHRRVAARTLGTLLRGDLDWIVMKALEKERSRRYATAQALGEDVQRHLRHDAVLASPPSSRYRLRKYVRRHRVGVFAATAIAASLVAGAVAAGFGYVEAQDQAERARQAAEQAKQDRALAVAQAAEAERQKEAAHRAQHEADEQRRVAEAQALMACVETSKAEGVLTLLASILANGDSHATRSHDYPVRLVLEDFRRSLDSGGLEGAPEVEALLRRVAGNSFLSLGLFATAEEQLLRATSLRRATVGERHPLVAQSIVDEAQLRHSQGRYSEAIELLQDAQRRLPDPDPTAENDAIVRLGELSPTAEVELRIGLELALCDNLRHLEGYAEAEAAGRAARDLAVGHFGVDSRAAVKCGVELASVLLDQERGAEAELLLRTALDALDERDPTYGTLLNNYGSCLMQLDRLEEAEGFLRKSLDHESRLLADDNPDLAGVTHNLGTCLFKRGQLSEACALLERSLALTRARLAEELPEVGQLVQELCMVLERNGDLRGAERVQRERVQRLTDVVGSEHPEVAAEEGRLGLRVSALGNHAEAEALVRRSIATLSRTKSADPLTLAVAWTELAQVHGAQENWNEAVHGYEQALAIRRLHPSAHLAAATTLASIARANFERGEYALAEEQQREVLARIDGPGVEPTLRAVHKQRLATYLGRLDRLDEAEQLVREAVLELRSLHPPDHKEVVAAEFSWAQALGRLGRQADAEQLLRELVKHADARMESGGLAALANCLLAQGKGAEAEPFARKCLALRERAAPDEWSRWSAVSLVGESLRQQGRLDEAEPLLREAAEKMPDVLDSRSVARPEALRRLVLVCEALGRTEEAAVWRAKWEEASSR